MIALHLKSKQTDKNMSEDKKKRFEKLNEKSKEEIWNKQKAKNTNDATRLGEVF